ncbi:MAG: hypothetical protein ABW252_18990 [Polyangiales bacterium]
MNLSVASIAALTAACGADDPASSPSYGAHDAHDAHDHGGHVLSAEAGDCQTFGSSYEAIQKLIFERNGCTASACHGEAKVGGLDLRAEASWENLVDAPSANSRLARVQPGTATDSFLYQKLRAASEPGSVQIAGSPMPVGTSPLTANELEAIQIWIKQGAPKTGTVADKTRGIDVGGLLDACLPPVKPTRTKPLEPPAPDEGVQLRLPVYMLKANSEIEQCTPFAYDLTKQVPAAYKDEARNVLFVNGSRVRQDSQSHHLVLWNPKKALTSVPAGEAGWTCRGGTRAGQRCEARNGGADCGEGSVCAGKSTPGTLCGLDTTAIASGNIFTPEALAGIFEIFAGGGLPAQIANTQSPQQYTPPLDGVFSEIPLKGILWFNSHAFNLTDEDTELEARVNYFYAKDRKREMRPVNVAENNWIADGQAPFTRKTYCKKHVVPLNHSLAMMTGHTHRRGEHFWVTDAAKKKIYESFDYNDAEYRHYTPWLEFTSPNNADRTLEYCATFNNGLTKDDKPDLNLVTRKSRMPSGTSCVPTACVAGKVTAACKTNAECDSAPGRGDGSCDACPIKGGQTTENEMFVMMPWYVLPAK